MMDKILQIVLPFWVQARKYTDAKVAAIGEGGSGGTGIASVEQTTTSTKDGGENVVTVTLSDGTASTFTVRNGSKGSTGDKGDPCEVTVSDGILTIVTDKSTL